MAFADVDAFIDKIMLEHKFDYLCSNHFEEFVYEEPVINLPKDCFEPNIENKENEVFKTLKKSLENYKNDCCPLRRN